MEKCTEKPNNLPEVTAYITGHNASTGKAVVESTRPALWRTLPKSNIGFNVIYTTSEFPASLDRNEDLTTHDRVVSSGKLGLVNPHGTVCRMVDFPPGNVPIMHRTQSLDYGIVLEGEVEMELDSGEVKLLKRGDVAVQRATMHAWKNASTTEWCRMIFVLQDCQPLLIGGEKLGEHLAGGTDIPPSGNDT